MLNKEREMDELIKLHRAKLHKVDTLIWEARKIKASLDYYNEKFECQQEEITEAGELIMAKRGRSKPASSKDDKSKRTDEESPSESVPLNFEYETEDGLKVAIDPSAIEFSREYEVAEDLNVELSVEFDWGVADLDVKKGVDDLAVSGEIGLPGDILGIGGGIIIDLETGEVEGGEVSAELGGAEVELSVSESGCQIGMQISFMGIGIGINKDICEDDEEEEEEEEEEDPPVKDPFSPASNPYRISGGEYVEKFQELECGMGMLVFGTYSETEYDDSGNVISYKVGGGVGGPFSLRNTTTADASPVLVHLDGTTASQGASLVATLGKDGIYYPYHPNQFGLYGIASLPVKRYTSSTFTWNIRIGKYTFSPIGIYRTRHPFTGYTYAWTPSEGWLVESVRDAAVLNFIYYDSPCEIPLLKEENSSIPPSPIPPSPPPMRNKKDCCTESTKLLLELHKVFRVTEVLEKGFPLPANQVSPGGKGKLINKDYATIIKRLFQAINMRTPAPFTAMVADADPTTPGDQPLTKTYPEATSAMQEVVELLLKNQIDDQTTLNFLIRQSILQGELMLVAQENRSILHTILYGSGIPFKESVGKVLIPFDLDPMPDDVKKSKQEKALDVSQNDAVKKLLPEFLRTAEETYDAYGYDESAETLWYYITMLYMRLKGFK